MNFGLIVVRIYPIGPPWCFLPLAGWYAITCELLDKEPLSPDDMPLIPLMQALAALGAWRPSQDVFTFDPTVYEAIAGTELSGAIPCDVALRLPVWCAYLELQGDNAPGVFVHLEEDANNGRNELRFLFHWASGEQRAVPLHLGNFSLEESIARMMAEAKKTILRSNCSPLMLKCKNGSRTPQPDAVPLFRRNSMAYIG